MPIKIIYDSSTSGVELSYSGIVKAAEIFDAMHSISTTDKYANLRYCISDRTFCEALEIDVADVESLVDKTRKLKGINPGLIVAMVAPDDLNFGMSRMYEMKGEDIGFNMMVFRDRESADEWLKIQLN